MLRLGSLLCLLVVLALSQPAHADPVDGPISGVSRVKALSVNEHKVLYKGGEQADFAIVGDGDTDLNLIVVDEEDNVIVKTAGPGDRCHVKWTPRKSGYYYIRVVNEGKVYNEYKWKAF